MMCKQSQNMIETTILSLAATDLEELRQAEEEQNSALSVSSNNTSSSNDDDDASSSVTCQNRNQLNNSIVSTNRILLNTRFPSNCLKLLYNIQGNLRCMDCDASNPQWATLTFGALICIDCSGRHRQMGVNVSVVRSITMDSWKHSDIIAMLEGGNKQLSGFFERHELSQQHNLDHVTMTNRYQTNAAKFYKKNLSHHVLRVMDAGRYMGRDAFRKSRQKKKRRSVAKTPTT